MMMLLLLMTKSYIDEQDSNKTGGTNVVTYLQNMRQIRYEKMGLTFDSIPGGQHHHNVTLIIFSRSDFLG